MGAAQTQDPDALISEAMEFERRADLLKLELRECQEKAAMLRAKAERYYKPEGFVRVPRPNMQDPLVSAAAVAIEDLQGVFTARQLAEQLGIPREERRAVNLLAALAELGNAVRTQHGWRAVDPVVAQVRDAVVALGGGGEWFSRDQLCLALQMSKEQLSWYLDDLERRDMLKIDRETWRMRYQRPRSDGFNERRSQQVEREFVERQTAARPVEGTGRPMVETGGNRRRAGERKSRGGTVRTQKKRGR